jgi:hypothetical protein
MNAVLLVEVAGRNIKAEKGIPSVTCSDINTSGASPRTSASTNNNLLEGVKHADSHVDSEVDSRVAFRVSESCET